MPTRPAHTMVVDGIRFAAIVAVCVGLLGLVRYAEPPLLTLTCHTHSLYYAQYV